MGRCDDRELRREWLHRITDHDGFGEDQGGIERWLILTDGLGLDRDYVDQPGGRAAGDQVRRRGLCPFRAREAAHRGGRLEPDRAVRAVDPSPPHRRHAGQLRLHRREGGRLFPPPPRPGAEGRRLRPRLRQAQRAHRRAAAGRARGADVQDRRACGRSSTRCITPMSAARFRPAPSGRNERWTIDPSPAASAARRQAPARRRARALDAACAGADLRGRRTRPRRCCSSATASAISPAIVAELAARYSAPPAVIEKDVVAMLGDLEAKRVLDT